MFDLCDVSTTKEGTVFTEVYNFENSVTGEAGERVKLRFVYIKISANI